MKLSGYNDEANKLKPMFNLLRLGEHIAEKSKTHHALCERSAR